MKSIVGEIKHAGAKPIIKVGGSYKKFGVVFHNKTIDVDEYYPGRWEFYIDNIDCSSILSVINIDDYNIKIRFDGGDGYIGNILVIKFIADNGTVVKLNVDISAI